MFSVKCMIELIIHCIHHFVCDGRLDLFLQQNIVMNLFEDDYMLLSSTDGIIRSKSDTNLKEYQSFADLRFSKNKVISAVEWHPTIKGQNTKQTVELLFYGLICTRDVCKNKTLKQIGICIASE